MAEEPATAVRLQAVSKQLRAAPGLGALANRIDGVELLERAAILARHDGIDCAETPPYNGSGEHIVVGRSAMSKRMFLDSTRENP